MAFPEKDSWYAGFLTCLCIFLFIADLGGRDLWDIEEGMNGAIAQTMLSTGDWIVPVFNGKAFLDKPPLFNWMTAVSFQVFGITEFAARLPAALSAFGCVLLTFFAGRKMYSRMTGLLAAIILATSTMFLALARVVQYDVPFAFFTTSAMYCYISAMLDPGRRIFVIGLYAATACAVLVKGPLGIIIPGLAIAGHLVLTRQFPQLPRLVDPAGIVVFLVIAAPWYVLMERANPGYLQYFVIKQHFANLIGSAGGNSARHPEPFYYYVPAVILALLPWSLTLPQSICCAVKHREGAGNGLYLFLVFWVVGTLFLFSLATSKLSNYVLPIFPAAAILLGTYWERLFLAPRGARRFSLMLGIGATALVLILFTIYAVKEDPWTYWEIKSGVRWSDFERFVIVFSGLFGLAFILAVLGKHRHTFMALATISPFTIFFVLWLVAPGVDAYRGAKEIGMELDRLLPEAEDIYYYGRQPDSAIYYTKRGAIKLDSDEELYEYLAHQGQKYVLLSPRGRDSGAAFDGNYHVLQRIGNKAIVSNQPGPWNSE